MGKYLDLAKKVEERQRPEGTSTAKKEPSGAHALYHQTAEGLAVDCFAIDPHWLVDAYPELWRRLVDLDGEATRLEQLGASGYVYQRVLADIVAAIKQARLLYEKSGSQLSPEDSREQ